MGLIPRGSFGLKIAAMPWLTLRFSGPDEANNGGLNGLVEGFTLTQKALAAMGAL
jgi:hypothetical protein